MMGQEASDRPGGPEDTSDALRLAMRGSWIAIGLFLLLGAFFFGLVLAGPCLSSEASPSPQPSEGPSETPPVGDTVPCTNPFRDWSRPLGIAFALPGVYFLVRGLRIPRAPPKVGDGLKPPPV